MAVADGTVDARRATGSSSAEYLRQLSMSQRSNGVFINDPKGLFILRWYREVKGDGTPPDGPPGASPLLVLRLSVRNIYLLAGRSYKPIHDYNSIQVLYS